MKGMLSLETHETTDISLLALQLTLTAPKSSRIQSPLKMALGKAAMLGQIDDLGCQTKQPSLLGGTTKAFGCIYIHVT